MITVFTINTATGETSLDKSYLEFRNDMPLLEQMEKANKIVAEQTEFQNSLRYKDTDKVWFAAWRN